MKPFTLCMTGISGSGKTTLAKEIKKEFLKRGLQLEVLDGDETRKEVGEIFGHTKEERMKMNKVNRMMARILNKNGINVILAIVAPFHEMRDSMRQYFGDSYIEVYVKCSYEVCAKRDVKRYYKLQKEGKMQNLNGANDSYEEPKNPDIIVNTEIETVEEAVNKIVQFYLEWSDNFSED